MNTPSHVIMGAALFGGRVPKRAWAAALGGLLPDVPMFLIVAAAKFTGISSAYIFMVLYWQNWWQVTNAIAHNFWLWGGLLVFSVVMRERRKLDAKAIDFWSIPVAFVGSGLLHSAVDFLCHREDAHMHFWPLTRWTFMSPVSYWDPSHFGHIFGVFEAAMGLALIVVLFRRFQSRLVRLLLGFCGLTYVLIPAYFILG
jgi:hypothetical protein